MNIQEPDDIGKCLLIDNLLKLFGIKASYKNILSGAPQCDVGKATTCDAVIPCVCQFVFPLLYFQSSSVNGLGKAAEGGLLAYTWPNLSSGDLMGSEPIHGYISLLNCPPPTSPLLCLSCILSVIVSSEPETWLIEDLYFMCYLFLKVLHSKSILCKQTKKMDGCLFPLGHTVRPVPLGRV